MKKVLRLLLLIQLLPLNAWAELREYTVAGDSMSPALHSGYRVTVDTDSQETLQRDGLVAVALSGSSGPMVKRLAAIPGDRVDFKDDAVWVNGNRIREIDPKRWKSTMRQLEWFKGKVPDRHYLILGDNPLNSRDSARLGLISLDRIKGRVVRVTKGGAQP